MLFSLNKDCLTAIKKENIKDNYLEKDIQSLTEKNLQNIFGLDFIDTEFQVDGLRIDTLAYDKDSNNFVIIEYKKSQNISVIDQGFTYLSLMLQNKADFVLNFNNKKNQSMNINDFDWSQSKIIFVSPSFSKYQIKANSFKDLPIELCEFSKYNNIVEYQILDSGFKYNNIKNITGFNGEIKKITSEIKVYSEEYHFSNSNKKVLELYESLKEKMVDLNQEIDVTPKKLYVAFKIYNKNFVCVVFKKNFLKLFLNIKHGDIKDDFGISQDVSNIGHWGTGDYQIHIKNGDDLEKAIILIKQSYNINKD